MLIEKGSVALRLRFEEPEDTSLLQVTSALYDLNLLHDCIVLATVPEYADFSFATTFWRRNARPLKPQHRLYLWRINRSSPLELVTAVTLASAAIGIPWIFVQTIEKIGNWRLNWQRLRLEAEKLRLEVQELQRQKELRAVDQYRAEVDLERSLLDRQAMEVFLSIMKNLEQSELRAIDVRLYLMKREEDGVVNS